MNEFEDTFTGRLRERVGHWRDVLTAPRESKSAKALTPEQAQQLYALLDDYAVNEGEYAAVQAEKANHAFIGQRGGWLEALRAARIPVGSLIASGLLYVVAYDEEIDEVSALPCVRKVGAHEALNMFTKRPEKAVCFKLEALPDRSILRMFDSFGMLDIDKTELELLLPEPQQQSLHR